MSEEMAENISWTELLEAYFASTGEKAHCLSWIHTHAEGIYSFRRTWIDLPVIVGSGAIAFLNGASSTLWSDPKMSSIALGIGSLVVGIWNSLGTYFGFAKRAEAHRIAAIHYAKLYRFLCVEMALPRSERMRPSDLLKFTKEQYDRLAETSPALPQGSIQAFRSRFSSEKYSEISKPEIANGLEKIEVFIGPPPISLRRSESFEVPPPPAD
jgi:hypothetical protein